MRLLLWAVHWLISATIGMCRMKVIRQNHISDGYSEEKYILIKIFEMAGSCASGVVTRYFCARCVCLFICEIC